MKTAYLIFILLTFFSVDIAAIEKNKLRVVANEHPLLQYEKNGKAQGPTVEILQSVLKQTDLDATVEFMPWPRAFNIATKNPNTIILSIIRTPEREDKFHWLGVVSKLARVFISLEENQSAREITDIDAKEKLIAVTRNSNSYHELKKKGFSENKNLYIVASDSEAFKLLISGKVDLVYNDPNAVEEYLESKNINQHQLQFNTIVPANRRDSYIAININSNIKIVETLKQSMKAFQKTDQYQYLLNKKGGG